MNTPRNAQLEGEGRCKPVPIGAVWAVGVTGGVFCCYVEILRAHRADYWVGATGLQWLGTTGALVAYIITITALAFLLAGVLRKPAGALGLPARHLPFVCGLLALWAVWSILLTNWEGGRLAAYLFVAMCSSLLVVSMMLVARIQGTTVRTACLLCVGGLLAATTALVSTAHLLLLYGEARRQWVGPVSMAWGVFAGLLGTFLWLLIRKRPLAHWGLWGCISFGLPPLVFLLAPTLTQQSQAASGEPNLLLVTFDAMRADAIAPYGGTVQTPALTELARRGTTFQHASSLAPWTLPSLVGMVGSAYPPSLTPTGSRQDWLNEMRYYVVPTDVETLAEKLAQRGYATCMLSGNKLVSHREGMLRGFQHTAVFLSTETERRSFLSQTPFLEDLAARAFPARFPERPVDTSRVLTQHALAFLRSCGKGPFFLWVHFMDPHSPLDPPARYRTSEGPWPLFAPDIPKLGTPVYDREFQIAMSEDDKPYVQDLYDAEIRYVDACLGRLLTMLSHDKRLDETCVCVTADHGEEFWERGRYGHGQSLHDEIMHVPLILAGAGIGVQRVDNRVSLIDVMPTLAELLGLEPSATWTGNSLMALLGSSSPGEGGRPCFAQATYISAPDPARMVVHNGWKLIEDMTSGEAQLYNLSSDPLERHDLATTEPEMAETLRAVLAKWGKEFPSTMDEVLAHGESPMDSDELMERLGGMGYIH